jgi:glycosyltransferase involved in cell wall biosynthesis
VDPAPCVLTINRVGFLGGVERVILSIGTAARRSGFGFVLACPGGDFADAAAAIGLDVETLAIDRSKRTSSPLALARIGLAMAKGRREITALARRKGARLLHAHHPIGALYAAQAAHTLGLPLILHVHETLPASPLYRFALRRAMPYCGRFACVSDASVALMRHMGAPEFAVQRLYNGVDDSFAAPPAPVPALAGPGPHIGHFGVLEPRKGQDIFVRAAAAVLRDHPTAQFWIVGKLSFADNAAYLAALRRGIAEAGLEACVTLVGHRSDVPDWMAGMDAIVLASREQESLPTVLIEGATIGRPLIATDIGGVREIIEHGRTGLIVPPGDADALAAAIGRALGPEGASLGRAAAAAARRRFGGDRFARDIASLYRDMLATRMEHAA